MKLFIFFVSIIYVLKAFSQGSDNLVPNGSFELMINCPDYAQGFYIDACEDWTSPTLGTPDYFNSCSLEFDFLTNTYLFSIPNNYQGYQYARTGSGYAGFAFSQLQEGDKTYAEYIQVKLKHQLEANKIYKLSFYINNPGVFCPNSIGAYFSTNEINQNHDTVLVLHPQIQSDLTNYFCDTLDWTEVKGYYSANGGEEYITIGVFSVLNELKATDLNGNIVTGPGMPGVGIYLYIDDVMLSEVKLAEMIPNVFTPNNDGINDIFSINAPDLEIEELIIYNRWGAIVYKSSNDFEWSGKTSSGLVCTNGVYFYVVRCKNNESYSGFFQIF